MSDIQRYAFDSFGPGHPGGVIIHADDGVYVLHEDMVAALAAQATAHEAALAEAEQRGFDNGRESITDEDRQNIHRIRQQGYAAALDAARDAVAALFWSPSNMLTTKEVLAAIDALRGES